ncbi:MAG TPA: hypothetical protein PK992_16475 [Planctomycetaceae bacterium]|nr:hypothetical protein [Planctomycetaceae bacterium]
MIVEFPVHDVRPNPSPRPPQCHEMDTGVVKLSALAADIIRQPFLFFLLTGKPCCRNA